MASHTATFALLSRALREDNRLKQTYVARAGLVCFVLLLLFSTHAASGYSGAPGLMFFSEIVWLNLWFISITGLSYFAAAVAEEKEEATLGLLRMTNLGPLTILLGKSTSRLLGVALLLCVQLPFTLLAVTLGGVSAQQILAGYVTLGTYIFFLCNLALVFSVILRGVGPASAVTGLALIAFFVAPSLGQAGLKGLIYLGVASAQTFWVRSIQWLLDAFAGASPAGRLSEITSTRFSGTIFGYQAFADIVLGLLCFGLAWAGFDRFTRGQHEGGGLAAAKPARARPPFRLWMWGAGRPWQPAVVWKDFFLCHGGLSTYLIQVIGFGLLLSILWYNHNAGFGFLSRSQRLAELGGTVFWISVVASACILAVGCARIFRLEIQGKTLSGLVGLPVSLKQIAWQKAAALFLSLAPMAMFAAGGSLLYVANSPRTAESFVEAVANSSFIEGMLAAIVQFVLFLYVTVFFSLRLKRLALPLALAACFLGNMLVTSLLGTMLFFGYSEVTLVFYHILLVGVIVALNFMIDLRLRALAAEES